MHGIEMALRAAGLGQVLDAANKMAEGDLIPKLIAFVDGMEAQQAAFERLEGDIAKIKTKLGIRDKEYIDGTYIERLRPPADEPVERGSDSNVA